MLLDIVAPWIIEAWSEFIAAGVFDLPRAEVTPYQVHVAAAVAALLCLWAAWSAVGAMPWGVRALSRSLMTLVLLAPVGVFVARHVEAMVEFAHAPAGAQAPYAGSAQAPYAGSAQAPYAGSAQVPAGESVPAAGSLAPRPAGPDNTPSQARQAPVDEAQPAQEAALRPRSPLTQPLPPAAPLTEVAPSEPAMTAGAPPAVVAREADAEPMAAAVAPTTAGAAASAITRAAAGLTRMLPRAPEADLMPVFYGTDRAIDRDAGRLDYTADRAGRLDLGRALVRVPRRHLTGDGDRLWAVSRAANAKPGEPVAGGREGSFSIVDIAAMPAEAFEAAAAARLAASRRYKGHALVFVHGFNTGFEMALCRAAQIAYDLRFDGAPFVYSWPSAGRVVRYGYDGDSVRQAQPHFADFLRTVMARTGATSVSVIAHGLGGGLVLDTLVGLRAEIPPGVTVQEVILSAPDVERATFAQRVRDLAGVAGHITLYTAASDRGLNISRRFTGGVPRAGDVLDGSPLVLGGVDTVDASVPGVDAIGRNHAGYVEAGSLVADIAARIGGSGGSAGLETVTSPGGSYRRLAGRTVNGAAVNGER